MLLENNISTKSFVLAILKQFKWYIIGLLLVCITWALSLAVRPYILKVIIDRLQAISTVDAIDVSKLSRPLIYYTVLNLLVTLLMRYRDYLYLNLSPNLKRHIGNILMQRMMQHSLMLFHNNFSGNLGAKLKDVMSGIPDLIKMAEEQFSVLLALIFATITMWSINYQFALLFIIWLLFFTYCLFSSTKYASQLCLSQAEMRNIVVGQIIDILSNIINVKLFAAQKQESNNLMVHLNNYVLAEKKRNWYFLWIASLQGLSFTLYQAIGFVLLIRWFKMGIVTAGDFALLISLNIAIIGEIWSLSKVILNFTEVLSNVRQGLKISLSPIHIQDKIDAQTLQVTKGKIEFDKVEFHYHGLASIFTNKSIIMAPGQRVGLVGYSGGGKSTFVNLILRLYDIKSGRILIDGQNVQDVTQDSLHQNIALIPQEPILFHRSLIENIRYGSAQASEEEVILAAKKANAHDFIMQLPKQYHTLVGERGVKLSGGQRQRVAIARAILKNAPILILDEATSQLDSLTEHKIQESLWQLMHDKTALVIAHRLSTLLKMDRILVFSQGKIIEDGSHQELLAKNGLYKELWDAQVGGFLIDPENT